MWFVHLLMAIYNNGDSKGNDNAVHKADEPTNAACSPSHCTSEWLPDPLSSVSPLSSTFPPPLPLTLKRCCVHWTELIASVSGSMRALFTSCKLNFQFLTPPFFKSPAPSSVPSPLSHFPLPSESAPILLPRLPSSISSSCYHPVVDSHCPFIAPSLANSASSIPILSACVQDSGCLLCRAPVSASTQWGNQHYCLRLGYMSNVNYSQQRRAITALDETEANTIHLNNDEAENTHTFVSNAHD